LFNCKNFFFIFQFQINIATSIGVIISRLQIDPIFYEDYEVIFSKVGKILATLLAVPKSSQLRLKSVEVTAQVLDVFKGEYSNKDLIFYKIL